MTTAREKAVQVRDLVFHLLDEETDRNDIVDEVEELLKEYANEKLEEAREAILNARSGPDQNTGEHQTAPIDQVMEWCADIVDEKIRSLKETL